MLDKKLNMDTIVVPASPEGFQNVFLGQQCWYSFKLSKRAHEELQYIAVYQTRPISAITHFAKIERIELRQDKKYIAYLEKGTTREIGPIRYDHGALTAIQSPRYFNLEMIKKSKSLRDLVG